MLRRRTALGAELRCLRLGYGPDFAPGYRWLADTYLHPKRRDYHYTLRRSAAYTKRMRTPYGFRLDASRFVQKQRPYTGREISIDN